MLSRAEVARHRTSESCWVIIRDHVYDVTAFLPDHPGGIQPIILRGGQDATEDYEEVHPQGLLESTLPCDCFLGPVEPLRDRRDMPRAIVAESGTSDAPKRASVTSMLAIEKDDAKPRHIATCVNLFDLQVEAQKILSRRALVFFNSAAEDLSSERANLEDWTKIQFVPRVLRNVARANTRRRMFRAPSDLPFFIAPTAMARLAHPDGELALVQAATQHGIPCCLSKASSVSRVDLAAWAQHPDHAHRSTLVFQLYVPRAEREARALIREVKALGYKGLVVTVDTAVVGKRDEDDRYKAELEVEAGLARTPSLQEQSKNTVDGVEKPIPRGVSSSTLNWEDLKWIREEWGADTDAGPLVLKGIQSSADAKLAVEHGIKYIYLSNHGGRQVSSAPSSILTLLDIRRRHSEVLDHAEVYLDGGVRRGADVLKALCLGATGVALGRPFLHGLGAYGVAGVLRVMEILQDEIETTMRLIGVGSLDQLSPELVNTARLERDLQKWTPQREVKRYSQSRL